MRLYVGLSCEVCKDGYKRADSSLGTLSQCVPCECSGRTDGAPLCHPLTGQLISRNLANIDAEMNVICLFQIYLFVVIIRPEKTTA